MQLTDSKLKRRSVFTKEGVIYELSIDDQLIIGVESITIIEKGRNYGVVTTIPAIQVRYIISK